MELAERYAYTVYTEKSFTAAAKALFISQPALSAMILKLEKSLGFRIFDRNTSGLTLTPSGRIYIEYLGNMLNEEKTMQERIRQLSNTDGTTLTIYGSCQTAHFLLPAVCSKFSRCHPNVFITVDVGNDNITGNLFEKLKSNQLDIVLTYDPLEKGLFFAPIFRDRLLIAAHKQLCPPALLSLSVSREEILSSTYSADRELETLSPLSCLPFLQRESATTADFIFSKLFHDPSTLSRIRVCNAKSLTMHYNMLREGIAATFVFDSHLPQAFFDDPSIVYFIPKSAAAIRTLNFAIKESRKDEPLLREFISTAKSISHIQGLKHENLIRDFK